MKTNDGAYLVAMLLIGWAVVLLVFIGCYVVHDTLKGVLL